MDADIDIDLEKPDRRTLLWDGLFLLGGIAIGILVAGLLDLTGLFAPSRLVFEIDTWLRGEPPFGTSNQTFRLSMADARYLNRVFTERSNEVAYCTLLTGNQLVPWLADTQTASNRHVEFSTQNCPSQNQIGTLHSHPGGNPRLSPVDKQTLVSSEDSIMCVQAGTLEVGDGIRADELYCYKYAPGNLQSSGTFLRVPVYVVDTTKS